MTTTLADINKTLIEQNKSLDETSEGINSLVDKISAQMDVSEKNNLKQLEEKRETRKARVVKRPSGLKEGFMQGTGVSGLAEMLSNIIPAGLGGMLSGALGLAFGKLFKGAVVGGLIATFFGDEIMAWVRSTFDKDADGKIFEGMPFELNLDNPLTIAGLTLATGVIANALVGFVAKGLLNLGVKGIAKAFSGVGRLLAAGLGLADDVPTESGTRRRGGRRGPKPPKVPGAGVRAAPGPSSRAISPKAQATAAKQIAKGAAVPAGYARNAAGALVNDATKKFASVDEVSRALALENVARYAKYAKALKFLGVAGAIGGAVIDPAMAIYNGESDAEVQTQIVGAIASIGVGTAGAILGGAVGGAAGSLVPGVGTAIVGGFGALAGGVAGALLGEAGAEKIARALLTGKAPAEIQKYNEDQAMSMPTQAGNYTPAMMATAQTAGPTQTLEQLQAIGAQTSAPTNVKVAPAAKLAPATISLMQNDQSASMAEIEAYLASIAGSKSSGANISMDDNSTKVTNNSGIVMPRVATVDLLDAGLALGVSGPR